MPDSDLFEGPESLCKSRAVNINFSMRFGPFGLKRVARPRRHLPCLASAACGAKVPSGRAIDLNRPGGSGEPPLPRDRGEYEKCAPDGAEKQAYDPKPAFPCKGGDCSDGNRDLEHRHAAREHFVLVKV